MGERLVLYDRRHHTVVDKRPWLNLGGQHIEDYAVRSDTWMDDDRIIRFTLKPVKPLPVRLDSVVFYLAYRVCCPPGKEAKAVASLAAEADPENPEGLTEALNRRLIRYVEDFSEGQGHVGFDFILDYFKLRGDAIKRLTARLLEELGLLFVLNFKSKKRLDTSGCPPWTSKRHRSMRGCATMTATLPSSCVAP